MKKLVVWGANAYIAKSDIDMIDAVSDVSRWSDRYEEYQDTLGELWNISG